MPWQEILAVIIVWEILKINSMQRLLFFLLFISCTPEDLIEDTCIKTSKECIVSRDQTITCTSYYECYK